MDFVILHRILPLLLALRLGFSAIRVIYFQFYSLGVSYHDWIGRAIDNGITLILDRQPMALFTAPGGCIA
jgi:hypothetical protein